MKLYKKVGQRYHELTKAEVLSQAVEVMYELNMPETARETVTQLAQHRLATLHSLDKDLERKD